MYLKRDEYVVQANVRLWHITDMPLALTKVCFGGKNGHDAGVTPFPLMTQSGHRQRPLAVTTVLACLGDLPLL